MINESQQEQASLYVMGLLSGEDAAAFEAELADNPELSAEVGSLNNATLALARAAPCLEMPEGGRARLMASLDAAAAVPDPGYHIVRNDEEGWLDTPIPGFRIKHLSVSPDVGHEMLMVEFAPGTRYPCHAHEYSEQLFIFSGSLQTEGRVLRPGDFIHGEPGSHHQELYSRDGCRALLVRRAA